MLGDLDRLAAETAPSEQLSISALVALEGRYDNEFFKNECLLRLKRFYFARHKNETGKRREPLPRG